MSKDVTEVWAELWVLQGKGPGRGTACADDPLRSPRFSYTGSLSSVAACSVGWEMSPPVSLQKPQPKG